MKKKISLQMIGIATVAIILTAILVLLAFYKLFQKQVWDDLEIYSQMILSEEILTTEDLEQYSRMGEELRITMVAPDGSILYDSDAVEGKMDNHNGRPEIMEAREKGVSCQIRQSDTIHRDCYYYAFAMEDGTVLRLARGADSMIRILQAGLPMALLVLFFIWILCAVIAGVLTNSLIEPIEEMANRLNHLDEVETYEELYPFVRLVKKQHEDIVKNATMRQDFTANVTHELKTPLTAISGYSELIENGMATEGDVRRFAGEIRRSANRLLTLINDTIRLSELDGAQRSTEDEEVNLCDLAETCVNMLKVSAENHKVNLVFHGKKETLVTDRQMMEELIYNLCDNAIRYNNPDGYVYVSVGDTEQEIYFQVQDTGIGIAKEHQTRIFERFYRVDKSRSKSTGGTGLGLAIVKHIVARCDARIELDSEVGKGTKITVYFGKDR